MDRRSFVRWLAALLVVFTVAPGSANDLPLGVFSTDTGLAVRFNSPANLAGNSKGFLAKAAPQFASIADQLPPAMGSLIGNPTLSGVDGDRPWYLVSQFRADKQPALVFAIPAKDTEAMTGALGTTYTVRAFGDWLIYSTDKEVIDALPETALAADKAITSAMAADLQELFNTGDIGLFINLPAISKIYQPQIDQFKEQLKDGSGAPNMMANAQISPELIDFLGEVLADSQALVSSIAIDDNALSTNAVFLTDPESRIGKIVAGQGEKSPSLLNRLPAGSMVYFGSTADFTDISRIATELFPGQPNADQAKKAVEAVLAHEPQEFASAFDLKSAKQGAYQGISLTQFGKPAGLLEGLRAIAKATPHVETEGWQQDTTWNNEAETVGETKVDVVRTVMTIDPKSDPSGNLNQFMKLMLGEEGFTQRIAISNNMLVQTNGGNTELMATALKSASADPTANPANPGLKTLRDQLGPEGHVLLAFDVPRSVGALLALLVESGAVPLPGNAAEAINNADQNAAYTGLQARAKGNQVHFRGILPALQVKGLVDLGMTIQQASQRGN